MLRPALVVSLTAIAVSHIANPCAAQSIWEYRERQRDNYFADTASRDVGDLVTVLIQENTDVQNQDQRQLRKTSDAAYNFNFAAAGDVGSGAGSLDMAKDSNRNFNGQSQYNVAQAFSDQITVPIIDRLPNGNLVIGGTRERLVSGEARTLCVSGTVREIDISPNNTVLSRHVANFKVCYEGDGPQSSFANQGWISRWVNRVWPF